jgi:hypothetical protein
MHIARSDRARARRNLLRQGIAAAGVLLAWQAMPASAGTSILFIGNSFTYGALASVQNWNTNTVTDLVGTNIGGVPALFKAFTVQAGLDYDVSLETQPGSNLSYHYNTASRKALIDKPWDKVVMHGQSNLDFGAPGNPASISQYTGLLGAMFKAQNPNVDISLTATWSRADLTYPATATGPWAGAPIDQMGKDVWAGYLVAAANNPGVVNRVNPVGLAWNRAFADGLADTNPYDGTDPGKINLWASDSYHASNEGYYLHALVVFGMVTGVNPTTLGAGESAAAALGISSANAVALQGIAAAQIAAVPEPSTWLMLAMGGGVLGWLGRRRRREAALPA